MYMMKLFLVLISVFCGASAKKTYEHRPHIAVSNGDIMIMSSMDKNIKFVTRGRNAGVSINDVDLLSTLVKAHNATMLTASYQQTLSTYSDRLEVLEQRTSEPIIINNSSDSINLKTKLRRLTNKIRLLERKVSMLTTVISNNDCASNPCQNGGICQDLVGSYSCKCSEGWEGQDCSSDINECARFAGTDLGCQNGASCINRPGSYECVCVGSFVGIHCTRRKSDCLTSGTELCGHGTCVAQNNAVGYSCICDQGWTTEESGVACTKDVDECKLNHPSCSANPHVNCINVPGSFYCAPCPPGFTGNGYHCYDIDECATNNGGCSTNPAVLCINTHGSRVCGLCPPGFLGDGKTCTYQGGVCNINNGGCNYLATCRGNPRIGADYVECICPLGYIGSGIGPNGCVRSSKSINSCTPNPCRNGICQLNNDTNDFSCICRSGYSGRYCDITRDPCNPNPCLNDGDCQSINNDFQCKCKTGFTGRRCETEEEACGGSMTAENGTLKFPSDDYESSDNGLSCAWLLSSGVDTKVLNITITKFDVEESPKCKNNWLEIHDGRNTAAYTLGTFCGNQIPLKGNFLTTHNMVYLWYHSKNRDAKGEFELTWKAVQPLCGATIQLTRTSHGTIQSPGSPGNYPVNRDCIWRLRAPIDKRILFTFFLLDIGENTDCNQDYLIFSSADFSPFRTMKMSDFETFCNSSKPAPFYSPGAFVEMKFHSDSKDTYKGFQLSYSVVEGSPNCGGVFTSPKGVVQSSEPANFFTIQCEYKIQQSISSKIRITFQTMELGDQVECTYNYLKIFEGPDDQSPSSGRFCGNKLPAPYISNGNQLLIQSSLLSPNAKWKFEYEKICAAKYTEESGSISPGDSDTDCIYQIERPPGDIIMLILKIRMMNEYFSNNQCSFKSVEVRDGDHENSTLIGRYCREETINITSTHNALWIRMNLYPNLRTTVQYTSVNVGCGGIMRSKFGIITPPAHPDGYYPSSLKCTWVIIAPPQHVIQLTWMTFNVEQSYECAYDNVQVFDNNTDLGMGGLMGKFCGFNLPPVLLSSSNIMTVMFHTDVTVNMDGFRAPYTMIEERSVCGGNYFTSAGVIKSPGYPEPYPINRECSWTINVKPGQQILLNITDFDIESYSACRYDWLEIRNGGTSASPLIGKFCGTTIPREIPSHTNKLYLYFKSDLSRSGKGFRITWSSTATGCGGILNSPSGSIISPHYPEAYSRNTECFWRIITSAGSRIQVVFSDINLEKHAQCLADYVQLFDGLTANSNSLGKFCYKGTEPIKSTNNNMLVKFRSDVAFQGRGFQLHYSTVCKNTIEGFQGVIESPNFPNEYPQDEDCLWEIIVSRGNKINITFSHFELERSLTFVTNNSCSFDYVEIRYGEKLMEDESDVSYRTYGKYCGDQNPGHLSLDSDHVQIHFVSDKLLLGTGFRLEWVISGCGGHLKKDMGTISSPNYPNPYPNMIECEWLIEVAFGFSIEIVFEEVDVEEQGSCEYDSVSIYNGMDDTYNLLSRICRQKTATVITSTGNFMFVKFSSDISYSGKGFTANYKATATNCGGRFTASEGAIFSPNYPKNYNKNETCEYFILVDDGHSIELRLKDLDLYKSENCSRNYVKIHDGPTAGYPVLQTLCGNETPNTTIKSTYNNMFIEFRGEVPSKGFHAEYSKSCGSRITTQGSGNLELHEKEFNDIFPSCVWTVVSTDPTKHVSLTITHMHGQFFCDYDESPIKIFNGESTDSPLLGSYCGLKVPPTLVSDGSALTIEIDSKMSFFATYSVYDSHCGGTLTSSEGFFSTPGYPKKYAFDTECEWTIRISSGNHVTLNFIDFDIVESDNCNSDYLEIRSNNATGPLQGVYCGKNKPTNLTHLGSLWLMYRGSKLDVGSTTITAKGFYAEYELNEHNELTGTRGEIDSPLYPYVVSAYKTFSWKITVAMKKRVLLTFKEFHLEAEENSFCYLVSFEVFDGVDETGNVLGRYCGLSLPQPIKSTSNIMFIRVDYSSPRLGSTFRVSWEEIDEDKSILLVPTQNKNCSNVTGEINLDTLGNYTLTSPGYPGGYAPNLNCEWIFTTIPMNHLIIFFKDIDLYNNRMMSKCNIFSDYVRIYQRHSNDNDWQVVTDVCKKDEVSKIINTTEFMKVQFLSTRLFNGTGFQAVIFEYCGGILTEPTGYIIFDESTPRDIECQWNITVRSTRTIKLTFEKMDIEHDKTRGCDNFLMVRNGRYSDSPLLGIGKYCGAEPPEALTSTGNNLYIKYRGPQRSVFRLKYEEISASCGGEVTLSQFDKFIEISSPNYPNIPNPHLECQWLIRTLPGELLRIDFEDRFDLTYSKNCDIEYVEVKDGGTEFSRSIGKYCKSTPSSQLSTDNIMFVKFFTDTDDPKTGFKARVSMERCGGTIRSVKGKLTFASPANGKNFNCTWHLTGLTDHYLSAKFTMLDLTGSCNKNYIKIYENLLTVNGPTENVLERFCGKNISQVFNSSGSDMYVNYVGENDGKFNLNFQSSQTECGGKVETESGEIESPGYPMMNHLKRYCSWTIVVPKGRRITLNILDSDFGNTSRHLSSGVAIFDGDFSVPNKPNMINRINQNMIESSENVMTVLFWSSEPSEHRGFKANFSSNEPTICLGDFTSESGVISTPPFRNTSYYCHWTHRSNNLNMNQTTAMAITLNTNIQKSATSPSICRSSFAFLSVFNNRKECLSSLCSSTKSTVITRSPFITTIIQAKASRKYELDFKVTYSTHDCGGLLIGQSGIISSPNFPNKPPKTFECVWLLNADEGQTINITVLSSNFGDDCEKSFLTIYNGGLPTHPRIGKYCRNDKPDPVLSQDKEVWIEYRWEQGSTGTGFQLKYEATSSGCGGIFHDKSRTIQSPNYAAGDYPNNAECLWMIESQPGYHIELKFTDRYNLEDSVNCTNDYLEVFDWRDEMWVTLGRHCGRVIPSGLTSSSEKMKILFRSNDKISAKGFKLTWTWQCGGRFVASKTPRVLVSPGYPIRYENDLKCEYTIVTKSDVLNLKFLDFEIEAGDPDCKFDNVTINANFAFLLKQIYCGDKLPPPMRMKGVTVVTFMTDKWLTRKGFKLEYVDESCGGDITEETMIESKKISDSNIRYISYVQPKISCSWNITAPPNQIVILEIKELNMRFSPMCFGQNVQVFKDQEGRANRLAQLCGNLRDQYPISSTSNRMLIKLEALPSVFGGFKAEVRFSHGPAEGCGGTINLTETMYIQSPYLDNLDCVWKIIAPRDYQIQIQFTKLNLMSTCAGKNDNYSICSCPFIEVKDGGGPFSELIEKICPNSSIVNDNRPILSSTNTMFLRILLRTKQEDAFKATLKPVLSICGPSVLNVTSEIKTLTSPNYPNPYPPNIKCVYSLSSTGMFERISLHFDTFDLSKETKAYLKCTGDTLQIYEDPNMFMVSEGLGPNTVYNGGTRAISLSYSDVSGKHIFCGNEVKPFDFYSSGKSITIALASLNSLTKGKGFKLEYSIAGCNRNYTGLQGRIYNGNNRGECYVSIIVPENMTISLYFSTFFMFHSINCTDQAFEVRDGSPNGKVLETVCGYRVPNPIFSYTNKLYLHIWNHRAAGSLMRYDLVYTSSSDGRGCGGELYNNKGKIYSPLYPNPFRNDTTCTWTIKVPVGLHAVLKFNVLDIQGDCGQSHIIVRTYAGYENVTVNTFEICRDYAVGSIIRSESFMEVEYKSSIHNGGTGWIAQFQGVSKDVTEIY